MELSIVKYIKEYGLSKALTDFSLKVSVYDKKMILRYSQLDSPMAHKEVQECRGLILEKDTLKVMSLAYTKFFNLGEGNAAQIDWNTAHVYDKVDGTKIQMYYDWHKNVWHVGTTGTAEAEGEINNRPNTTFASLFWETVKKYPKFDTELLNKDIVYIYELMTPYNIVVTPHSESMLTLTGARNRETLNEIKYDGLKDISIMLGVPLVKRFDLNANADELLKTFINMPWSQEGYVVCDANFNRIKIKNPAYLAVHHLKDKTAAYNIMEVVKSNEIEEFAATFVERREEITKLKNQYDLLIIILENMWDVLKKKLPLDDSAAEKKRFALSVKEFIENNPLFKTFEGMFFGLQGGRIKSVKECIREFDNKVLYLFFTKKVDLTDIKSYNVLYDTKEEYLERVLERNFDFEYPESVIKDNKEYFINCWKNGLGCYKALVFFEYPIRDEKNN